MLVHHEILLPKLVAITLSPVIVNWVISFLTDRKQMCKKWQRNFNVSNYK